MRTTLFSRAAVVLAAILCVMTSAACIAEVDEEGNTEASTSNEPEDVGIVTTDGDENNESPEDPPRPSKGCSVSPASGDEDAALIGGIIVLGIGLTLRRRQG